MLIVFIYIFYQINIIISKNLKNKLYLAIIRKLLICKRNIYLYFLSQQIKNIYLNLFYQKLKNTENYLFKILIFFTWTGGIACSLK